MIRQFKTKRAKIFFLLFLALGVIATIEIVLRIVLYLSLNTYLTHHIPERYRDNMSEMILGPTQYEYDPICYFLPKGGLFRISQGRTSYPDSKKNNTIRIICTGDSTTYGLAVDYEQSYPFLLEKLLKENYPNKKIQVLNAGFPGASERQVKRIFQFYLVKYNPDIVVFRKELYRLSDSYEVPENSNKIRYFIWRSIYDLRIFRALTVATRTLYREYPLPDRVYDFIMYTFLRPAIEKIDGLGNDFQIVRKIADQHGVPYIMAVDYIRRTGEGKLTDDCQQYENSGISPVVCTNRAFQDRSRTTLIDNVFVDSEHLTETGTAIIAQEIYRFIVDQKWIELLSESSDK